MKRVLILFCLAASATAQVNLSGKVAVGGKVTAAAAAGAAAGGGGSSKAFVGSTQGTGSSSASTRTVVRTLAAGNLAIACLKWEDAARTPSVSDTAGHTWTALAQTNNITQPFEQAFYATNTTAGSTTITANFGSATAFCVVHVAEFSGVQLAEPLDAQRWADTNGANIIATSTFTTAQANELLIAFAGIYDSSATGTPQAGWSEAWDNSAGNYGTHFQYLLNVAAGTYFGQLELITSVNRALTVAAFK